MALKVENDGDLDLHESSLDNSADSELLSMVDEGSFGSSDQHFLDAREDDNSSGYNFRDLSGVSYKVINCQMPQDQDNIVATHAHSIANPASDGEFFVITAEQMYGAPAVQKQKVIKKTPMQAKVVTAKKRDDKRRATHNEVERRRRDKINSWITKLAALVPNSGLPDASSKGCILAKACDHITELTQKQKRLEKLEVDNEKLVLEILRLNQELAELRKENSSMRSQLADNCIVVNQRPKGQKS